MESLFIECIEEVRKDIMKRRLKNEIYNRKKFQQLDKSSEEAKEFEESLLRLAQLAKNRVKVSDFTSRDKTHILDLFVNNEKTLLKIYEALFPHRAATNPTGPGQSTMSTIEQGFNQSGYPRSDQRSQGAARSTGSMAGGNVHLGSHLSASYNGPVNQGLAPTH